MSDTPNTRAVLQAADGRWTYSIKDFCESMERKLNEAQRELTETCERYEIACETAAKMHAAAVGEIKGPHIDPVQDVANVRRERDEYRGLLIELYNDLNIIHSGNAVRKLSKMFRDENYN